MDEDHGENENEEEDEDEDEDAHEGRREILYTISLTRKELVALKMSPNLVMDWILERNSVPPHNLLELFTEVKLVHSFSSIGLRKQLVLTRLKALAVWTQFNKPASNFQFSSIIYEGNHFLVNILAHY